MPPTLPTSGSETIVMFKQVLSDLEACHQLRRLRPIESATGPVIQLEGRSVILLASNDYLGLATHPALKQAAVAATEQYGVGSGAARLISGTLPPHTELEAALATFKGTEAALVFGSGYLANLGLIPALMGRDGLILADRLCHASLLDGCRLSGAELRRYRHGDVAHLQSLLAKRTSSRKTLIVTDGVFSMDGDLAPLPDIVPLAERYGATLLVDDAHGTGVMGASGHGTLEHFGLKDCLSFHMGTLGKALGTSGAYVAGTADCIRYMMNRARTFLFSTAPPPAQAAATIAALAVLQTEPERRVRLWENREHLFAGLKKLGFRTTDSASPIMPVLIGDAGRAVAIAERLLQLGVYATAIRPPTVPKETSRIRLTVTSEHSKAHLDEALAALKTAGQDAGVI